MKLYASIITAQIVETGIIVILCKLIWNYYRYELVFGMVRLDGLTKSYFVQTLVTSTSVKVSHSGSVPLSFQVCKWFTILNLRVKSVEDDTLAILSPGEG